MAVLLFRLNNVPDDEAQDVRQLLHDHDIHFYETDAGFWRVGVDAIWLPDQSAEETARALIKRYQEQRTLDQQQEYAQRESSGETVSLGQKILAHPIRFLGVLIAVAFILGVSIAPFWFSFS